MSGRVFIHDADRAEDPGDMGPVLGSLVVPERVGNKLHRLAYLAIGDPDAPDQLWLRVVRGDRVCSVFCKRMMMGRSPCVVFDIPAVTPSGTCIERETLTRGVMAGLSGIGVPKAAAAMRADEKAFEEQRKRRAE